MKTPFLAIILLSLSVVLISLCTFIASWSPHEWSMLHPW
jgi:hypothetical protein